MADVKRGSNATLVELAKLLNDNPKLRVYIDGHTGSQSPFAHHLDLSRRRADAVAKVLATVYKVPAARMPATSVASLAPEASNMDDAGRAKNHCVERVVQ
ncbi:OmpA family protein [Dyella telluris]|uniref:OmpA family protein n=2 Tax=Dyella telluris TaxID=2763498 RepID=A0A7G8Q1G0_9GAMM|nr:OmpA family protein [Dyella telluris]